MPSLEQIEYATLLLQRTESDFRACQILAQDPEVGSDVVGFHAQQTLEKALKVALVLDGIDYPKTHDLEFLIIALTKTDAIEIPPELQDAGWLTRGQQLFVTMSPKVLIKMQLLQ